jgi:hypothetical protein
MQIEKRSGFKFAIIFNKIMIFLFTNFNGKMIINLGKSLIIGTKIKT